MPENNFTDRELLRRLMYLNDWNQTQLAEELGVTPAYISQLMNEHKTMNKPLRKLAEIYLERAETEQEA